MVRGRHISFMAPARVPEAPTDRGVHVADLGQRVAGTTLAHHRAGVAIGELGCRDRRLVRWRPCSCHRYPPRQPAWPRPWRWLWRGPGDLAQWRGADPEALRRGQ